MSSYQGYNPLAALNEFMAEESARYDAENGKKTQNNNSNHNNKGTHNNNNSSGNNKNKGNNKSQNNPQNGNTAGSGSKSKKKGCSKQEKKLKKEAAKEEKRARKAQAKQAKKDALEAKKRRRAEKNGGRKSKGKGKAPPPPNKEAQAQMMATLLEKRALAPTAGPNSFMKCLCEPIGSSWDTKFIHLNVYLDALVEKYGNPRAPPYPKMHLPPVPLHNPRHSVMRQIIELPFVSFWSYPLLGQGMAGGRAVMSVDEPCHPNEAYFPLVDNFTLTAPLDDDGGCGGAAHAPFRVPMLHAVFLLAEEGLPTAKAKGAGTGRLPSDVAIKLIDACVKAGGCEQLFWTCDVERFRRKCAAAAINSHHAAGSSLNAGVPAVESSASCEEDTSETLLHIIARHQSASVVSHLLKLLKTHIRFMYAEPTPPPPEMSLEVAHAGAVARAADRFKRFVGLRNYQGYAALDLFLNINAPDCMMNSISRMAEREAKAEKAAMRELCRYIAEEILGDTTAVSRTGETVPSYTALYSKGMLEPAAAKGTVADATSVAQPPPEVSSNGGVAPPQQHGAAGAPPRALPGAAPDAVKAAPPAVALPKKVPIVRLPQPIPQIADVTVYHPPEMVSAPSSTADTAAVDNSVGVSAPTLAAPNTLADMSAQLSLCEGLAAVCVTRGGAPNPSLYADVLSRLAHIAPLKKKESMVTTTTTLSSSEGGDLASSLPEAPAAPRSASILSLAPAPPSVETIKQMEETQSRIARVLTSALVVILESAYLQVPPPLPATTTAAVKTPLAPQIHDIVRAFLAKGIDVNGEASFDPATTCAALGSYAYRHATQSEYYFEGHSPAGAAQPFTPLTALLRSLRSFARAYVAEEFINKGGCGAFSNRTLKAHIDAVHVLLQHGADPRKMKLLAGGSSSAKKMVEDAASVPITADSSPALRPSVHDLIPLHLLVESYALILKKSTAEGVFQHERSRRMLAAAAAGHSVCGGGDDGLASPILIGDIAYYMGDRCAAPSHANREALKALLVSFVRGEQKADVNVLGSDGRSAAFNVLVTAANAEEFLDIRSATHGHVPKDFGCPDDADDPEGIFARTYGARQADRDNHVDVRVRNNAHRLNTAALSTFTLLLDLGLLPYQCPAPTPTGTATAAASPAAAINPPMLYALQIMARMRNVTTRKYTTVLSALASSNPTDAHYQQQDIECDLHYDCRHVPLPAGGPEAQLLERLVVHIAAAPTSEQKQTSAVSGSNRLLAPSATPAGVAPAANTSGILPTPPPPPQNVSAAPPPPSQADQNRVMAIKLSNIYVLLLCACAADVLDMGIIHFLVGMGFALHAEFLSKSCVDVFAPAYGEGGPICRLIRSYSPLNQFMRRAVTMIHTTKGETDVSKFGPTMDYLITCGADTNLYDGEYLPSFSHNKTNTVEQRAYVAHHSIPSSPLFICLSPFVLRPLRLEKGVSLCHDGPKLPARAFFLRQTYTLLQILIERGRADILKPNPVGQLFLQTLITHLSTPIFQVLINGGANPQQPQPIVDANRNLLCCPPEDVCNSVLVPIIDMVVNISFRVRAVVNQRERARAAAVAAAAPNKNCPPPAPLPFANVSVLDACDVTRKSALAAACDVANVYVVLKLLQLGARTDLAYATSPHPTIPDANIHMNSTTPSVKRDAALLHALIAAMDAVVCHSAEVIDEERDSAVAHLITGGGGAPRPLTAAAGGVSLLSPPTATSILSARPPPGRGGPAASGNGCGPSRKTYALFADRHEFLPCADSLIPFIATAVGTLIKACSVCSQNKLQQQQQQNTVGGGILGNAAPMSMVPSSPADIANEANADAAITISAVNAMYSAQSSSNANGISSIGSEDLFENAINDANSAHSNTGVTLADEELAALVTPLVAALTAKAITGKSFGAAATPANNIATTAAAPPNEERYVHGHHLKIFANIASVLMSHGASVDPIIRFCNEGKRRAGQKSLLRSDGYGGGIVDLYGMDSYNHHHHNSPAAPSSSLPVLPDVPFVLQQRERLRMMSPYLVRVLSERSPFREEDLQYW